MSKIGIGFAIAILVLATSSCLFSPQFSDAPAEGAISLEAQILPLDAFGVRRAEIVVEGTNTGVFSFWIENDSLNLRFEGLDGWMFSRIAFETEEALGEFKLDDSGKLDIASFSTNVSFENVVDFASYEVALDFLGDFTTSFFAAIYLEMRNADGIEVSTIPTVYLGTIFRDSGQIDLNAIITGELRVEHRNGLVYCDLLLVNEGNTVASLVTVELLFEIEEEGTWLEFEKVKLVSFEDELNIAPGTYLNISDEIPIKGRTRVTADIHSINSDSIRLVCIFEGDF
ncbi:hypothetical protein [uncultured Mesotoga sp.]|jgi:hypothetical protein|uniref:hypothetical protein n=1 Tax=uncultured Mesotoga sp. TaxID=1184400 RepID=UPI00259464B0|nr:hypothetical protein [uncultured Mesotoga sp.]